MWSIVLISVVTILYAAIAISKVYYADYAIAGMWAGYCIANIALLIREFNL